MGVAIAVPELYLPVAGVRSWATLIGGVNPPGPQEHVARRYVLPQAKRAGAARSRPTSRSATAPDLWRRHVRPTRSDRPDTERQPQPFPSMLISAPPTPAATTTLLFDGVEAVEMVAQIGTRDAAARLRRTHVPSRTHCRTGWIVRFQPPATGGAWVTDLLALVESWLAAAPIPCAKIRRAGRSYLIRGPLDAA